jgi:alkyl sulfatase BDS1-like metallo-beta-lactamase superfamily hydrolase
LSAAQELAAQGQPPAVVSREFSELFAMAPILSALNYLAIRLDGPRAADEVLTIEWRIRATDEVFTTHLENAVLHTRAGASDAWDIRITAGREALVELVLGRTAIEVIAQQGDVSVEGDAARADAFFALLDTFDPWFPLVTHVTGDQAE